MQQNNRNSSRDTYRTGRTNPPKSHQGIIALLLILVTVLCSIVTVLGMMNIRLHLLLQDSWQQPEGANQTELSLAEADGQLAFSAESAPILGLTCQAIDTLYRSYNGWPDGLYISQVTPDSAAQLADIRPGDILIAVNGTPISLTEDWEQNMAAIAPGQAVTLTLYREKTEFTVTLTKE